MAQIQQNYLFDWTHVDAASDMSRLRLVLGAAPDEPLVLKLERERGRGRDEYPVRPVWNAIVAGVVFQHPSIASLIRELRRNAELRCVCGFDPLLGEKAVPTHSAFSNFLETLMAHEADIREMVHELVRELGVHLLDLGRYQAIDGKALPSFGKPPRKKEGEDVSAGPEPATGAAESEEDRRRDTDADWGVKTYKGKRTDGTTWEKVVRWFGFELHLQVDTTHEIPLNYHVTQASAGESPLLLPLVEETQRHHPEIVERCKELSADKGYDSTENNKKLYDSHRIHPIIDKRRDWKAGEDQTRPVFPDRADTVVYDVKGTVSCVCPKTGAIRPMVPWGFERDRECLKYRCPAAAHEVECPGRSLCPGAQGDYGKIVRIPIELDRRMFTPTARDTLAWQRAYDKRTAVERVNSRLDRVLGFEYHTIRGLKKMETRVGIALFVLLAMALGRIRIGQTDQIRSLLAPVEKPAA